MTPLNTAKPANTRADESPPAWKETHLPEDAAPFLSLTPQSVSPAEKKIELERLVLEYLREHPRFFERHRAQIAELAIPAHQSEGTLSLMEKQREHLQETNHRLQASLALFEQHNKTHMEQLRQIHRLQCNLLWCLSLSDVVSLLQKQCQARLRYVPQLWCWDLPQSAHSTVTLLNLPVAHESLIRFAENAPALGYVPPGAEVDDSLAPYCQNRDEAVMILPLVPPGAAKQVRGLFVLGLIPKATPEDDQAAYQEHWLASRFAEWVARLIEGHWARSALLYSQD